MPRRKTPPDGATNLDEQIDQLTDEVRSLREEIRVLRESIDEFREAFEHAVRNPPDPLPPPFQLWSMPLDPTAPDFAKRLNGVSPEVIARLRDEVTGQSAAETSAPALAPSASPSASAHPIGRTDVRPGSQGRLF